MFNLLSREQDLRGRIPLSGLLGWYAPQTLITRATGRAVKLAKASSQFLTATNNASLQTGGGTSYTIAIWFSLNTTLAASGTRFNLITKDGGVAGTNREYSLRFENQIGMFFSFFENLSATQVQAVVTTQLPVTPDVYFAVGTWHLAVVTLNLTTMQLTITVDNPALNYRQVANVTAGHLPGNGTGDVRIGRGSFGDFADANIQCVGFWKKAISSAEHLTLWNNGSGAGLEEAITNSPSLATSLSSFWHLSEPAGATAYRDAFGTNDAAPSAGPTSVAGFVKTAVSQWNDGSGQANHLYQSFAANQPGTRPPLVGGIGNGWRSLYFNGLTGWLQSLAMAGLSQPCSVYAVVQSLQSTSQQISVDGRSSLSLGMGSDNAATKHYALNAGVELASAVNVSTALRFRGAFLNGANSKLYIDSLTPIIGNAGPNHPLGLTLGARGDVAALFSYSKVYEVICYNRELSTSEHTAIGNYLAAKYGLVLV